METLRTSTPHPKLDGCSCVIGWRHDIVNAQVAPMSGGLAENRSFCNECGQKGYMIKVLIELAIDAPNPLPDRVHARIVRAGLKGVGCENVAL